MSAEVPVLLVRLQEACEVARPRVGINRARQLERDGEWKSVRLGRRVLIYLPSVYAWIERQIENGDGAES